MALYTLFYTLYGLVIGSFLNVCIHRIPRGQSVVRPASRCPACGGAIRPYDNVPVLAYLWLLGRCRACKAPISPRYPLVELLCGAGFYLCAATWSFEPPTYVNSLFVALVIVLVFVDYDHQILPNVVTLPGAAAGLLLSPLQERALYSDPLSTAVASRLPVPDPASALPWIGSLAGIAIGGGMLLGVASLYELARKRQGLGMGDVKMMAMVGAFLGWRLSLLTIFAGSLLGTAAGLFLVAARGGTLQSKLAFGTFLGCAALLSLFFGLPLLAWYARLLS